MNEHVLNTTTSLCSVCKHSIPAQLWQIDEQIWMRKICSEHGKQEVLISSNADWYQAVMTMSPVLTPPNPAKPVKQGCPFDCGPCAQHEQQVFLPIVPITSSCNLDCPICYTHNRNSEAYQMSEAELQAVIKHIQLTDPKQRIINITGGEPTQHPQFERLIEICKKQGFDRITVSTHGLRFLKEENLLPRLANMGARIILSFDSFKQETNQQMLGGKFLQSKMQVLSLLEKHAVDTTLLPVLARGYNDDELGKLVQLTLGKNFIRSLELHTMTFTGQGGRNFNQQGRYTTYDVLADLEKQTEGLLKITDFVPAPSAHPLCYLITYILRLDDGRWLPFPRFMRGEDLRTLLKDSLYLQATPEVEQCLQDVITNLWSGEFVCENADIVLETLKKLLAQMFAPGLSDADRMRIGERSSKAIYIHSHMDEENFDTNRIRQCCVGIREEDGSNIPSCAYNVLYRPQDGRFNLHPAESVANLGNGRF